jgi:(p)ppGpp synthase/HD superfamily hydrolase
MQSLLSRAIQIAAEAHDGQVDKEGVPYILHPLTLLLRLCDQFGDEASEDACIVALLHDVLEDSDWTIEELRAEGFSPTVLASLEALTRGKEELYTDYILRLQHAKHGEIARCIKKLDLEHNMEILRLARVRELEYHDLRRLRNYAAAWRALSGCNDKDDGVVE